MIIVIIGGACTIITITTTLSMLPTPITVHTEHTKPGRRRPTAHLRPPRVLPFTHIIIIPSIPRGSAAWTSTLTTATPTTSSAALPPHPLTGIRIVTVIILNNSAGSGRCMLHAIRPHRPIHFVELSIDSAALPSMSGIVRAACTPPAPLLPTPTPTTAAGTTRAAAGRSVGHDGRLCGRATYTKRRGEGWSSVESGIDAGDDGVGQS